MSRRSDSALRRNTGDDLQLITVGLSIVVA
jgi:hypothetical protein